MKVSIYFTFGLPILVSLIGCQGGITPIKTDPKVAAHTQAIEDAFVGYYNKCGGNYDALQADDQFAVNKLTGGASMTKTQFSKYRDYLTKKAVGNATPIQK